MATQTAPQQLQPANDVPGTQVLNLREPPGGIEATREMGHSVQGLPHPYPLDKPPITINRIPSLDHDWADASRKVLIFTHQLPEDNRSSLYNKKLEHFQFYFWTALDRARRLNKPLDGSVLLWESYDLQGMLTWWRRCLDYPSPDYIDESSDGLWKDFLLSSPWFDCPVFDDLLWETVKDFKGLPRMSTDGKTVLQERNSKSAALEAAFFERWWLTASRLPLRRFENGDAVLPITVEYYQAQYGAAGMEWHMPPTDWPDDGSDSFDDEDD